MTEQKKTPQEKLLEMFRQAVFSLSEDYRPGESQRASKKRRYQAALTVEMIRKKLQSAISTLEANPDLDSIEIDLTAIDIESVQKSSNNQEKPDKQKLKKSPPVNFDEDDSEDEKDVNIKRRWVDLI